MSARGFYLYPSVPNTTAVTQERDQSFSLFKTSFQDNLRQMIDDRLARGKSVSFNATVIGELVFGGTDDETGVKYCKDSFAIAFSPSRNRQARATVGAAPLTRKCLTSEKVRHDCEDDPLNCAFERIEVSNHNACTLLTAKG